MVSNPLKRLLLIGGGGHCRSVIDVIRLSGEFEVVGILDQQDKLGEFVDGIEIIGSDDDLSKKLDLVDECLVTVGQLDSGSLRQSLYEKVISLGGSMATASCNQHFQKIASSDIFVYLDDVQYQRRGVQNRNQIKTVSGPAWLTVPVSGSRESLISEMIIANQDWQKKHLKTIEFNYKKAKFYNIFDEVFRPIFLEKYENLVDLNIKLCEVFLSFFDVNTKCLKSSSLSCTGKKESYIINICKEVGATTYLSGKGAQDYQTKENFDAVGLELSYHESTIIEYEQEHNSMGFVKGMSALDAILNMGEESKKLIL